MVSSPRALCPWVELWVHADSEPQHLFLRHCGRLKALWIGYWLSFPTWWQLAALLHSPVPHSRVALWHTCLIYLLLNSLPWGLHPALILLRRSWSDLLNNDPLPDRLLICLCWIPSSWLDTPKFQNLRWAGMVAPQTHCLGLLGCSLYASPQSPSLSGDWVLRPGFHLILGSEWVSIQSSMLPHLWQVSLEKYFRKGFYLTTTGNDQRKLIPLCLSQHQWKKSRVQSQKEHKVYAVKANTSFMNNMSLTWCSSKPGTQCVIILHIITKQGVGRC